MPHFANESDFGKVTHWHTSDNNRRDRASCGHWYLLCDALGCLTPIGISKAALPTPGIVQPFNSPRELPLIALTSAFLTIWDQVGASFYLPFHGGQILVPVKPRLYFLINITSSMWVFSLLQPPVWLRKCGNAYRHGQVGVLKSFRIECQQ